MTIGLVGRKVGMTRIFTDDGATLPVTVLDVSDNRVTQIKTAEKDGYAAVQVAFGKRRASRASHGNSISHNKPGSTGQNQSPGRVFPGKRMPGHLGDKQRTILNLEVVRVDAARQLLLVKGSVPGSSGRDVIVRPAIKITKPA